MTPCDFPGARLDGAVLMNAFLNFAILANTESLEADFAYAQMRNASLQSARAHRCIFPNADLTEASAAIAVG